MNSESPHAVAGSLCLRCGLCCDGTLFGSVELRLEDDEDRLRDLGLPIRQPGRPRFSQPCPALDANRSCQIYGERPCQCRKFECALFQSVHRGRTELTAAIRVVERTRRKADQIRKLLRELGETCETRPLSARFHTLRRRMESGAGESSAEWEERMDRYATLSLAVHELQRLLRREFYPDPSDLAEG